jgi:hypothetical protein
MARPAFAVTLIGIGVSGLTGSLVFACAAPEEDWFRADVTPPPLEIPAPLPEAHCEIEVEGVGVIPLETDYLPHVITCENGGANFEALKAQAIAARSVAYYYIENQGSVCDSQGCQVYSCGSEPSQLAYDAVDATSGLYLNYNDTLTYAFFVAGDPATAPPECIGDIAVGTEHWVTYNEGQSGVDVVQTELGWVFDPQEPGYGQNRGCMSQWGSRCLENDIGYDYDGILRFYYGADIEITQAQGPCVLALGGEGDGDGDGDGGDGDDGDGDAGDGDGDSGSNPDTGEECFIGALGCMCTMGGGCDPGLTCVEGYCEEDPSAGESGDGGETGYWLDDGGRGAPESCACTTDTPGSGNALGSLALLSLLGTLGRRRKYNHRAPCRS